MSAPLMGGLVQGHCVRRSRGGYRRALPASGGFGGLAIDALGGGPRAKVEFGLSLARRSGISPDGQLIAVERLHLDVLSKPCPSIIIRQAGAVLLKEACRGTTSIDLEPGCDSKAHGISASYGR